MADVPLTGGCLCGGVRFEISEPLGAAGYCHCKRCQRRTGTASSAQAVVARGSVRVTSGQELIRAYDPGDGFPKAFCSACGSALWSVHPEDGEVASVRLGVLDGDPGVTFAYRQFLNYAVSWESIPDDRIPTYPERRPPGT